MSWRTAAPLLLAALFQCVPMALHAQELGGDNGCQIGSSCYPFSTCVEWQGALTCRCDLGYHFDETMGCVLARTFPGQLTLQHGRDPTSNYRHSQRQPIMEAQRKVSAAEDLLLSPGVVEQIEALFLQILNNSHGYLSTSIMYPSPSIDTLNVLHYFSTLSNISMETVTGTIDRFLMECGASPVRCDSRLRRLSYQSLSLCGFQICDLLSTTCSFQDGLVECRCLPGYSKHYPADRACIACGSGFQHIEGACERCPFGFTGFNCEEPFLLALLLVSCSAGVFLLLALVFGLLLCTRKAKRHATPHLLEGTVLGRPQRSEAMRLPRVRSVWSRGMDHSDQNSGFSRYVAHLGSPSNGSSEILSPSEVFMITVMESQKPQGLSTLVGQQNLGFDSEEHDCPNES